MIVHKKKQLDDEFKAAAEKSVEQARKIAEQEAKELEETAKEEAAKEKSGKQEATREEVKK